MASVLALISKAVFERQAPGARVGARLEMDRYVSAGKGLTPLADGGALFLVTVRPGERLWLCAILDEPRFEETMWRAERASAAAIVDVTDLLPSLKLANGKGVQAPEGKLGMSLQTPRTLSDADDALLRAAAGGVTLAPARAIPSSKKEAAPPPAPPTTPKRVAATGDLLAQIIADPDDLALRRVYADQLSEAGDPHGEYIQLACAADALPDGDPKRAELEALALRLRRRHALAFSRGLRRVPYFNRSHEARTPFELARGFPEHVSGEGMALLDALPDAAKAAPLRALTLRNATAAELERLAAMPELARLRALEISSNAEIGPSLGALFMSPHLQRLESLKLATDLSAPLLLQLAETPALDGLSTLRLRAGARQQPSAQEVTALLRAPRLASLRVLALSDLSVDPTALGGLALLEDLELSALSIGGAKGAAQLAAAPEIAHLRRLALDDVDIGDKGLAALVGSPRLGALRELELSGMVSGKKLGAMLDALALPSLTKLKLAESPLRKEGAAALVAARKKLARLTALDLSGGQLKDDGMKTLGALALPSLTRLDLGGNGIGTVGMEALAESALFSTVRDLSIRNNKCGSEGGECLAQAKGLERLRSLALYYNWMGVKGVRALLAATPNLEELDAGTNNYGAEPGRSIIGSTTMRKLRIVRLSEDGYDKTKLARSDAAQTFEELSLSGPVDEEAAEAIAALPMLETLYLQFSTLNGDAGKILRARFGPFVRTWGDFDRLQALPGPE